MDDYDMQRGFRIPKNSKHSVRKRTSRNTSLPGESKSSTKPNHNKAEFPHLTAEERSYLSENYRRPSPGQLYGKNASPLSKKNLDNRTQKKQSPVSNPFSNAPKISSREKQSPANNPFSNAPRISSKDIVGHRVVTDKMAHQHLQQKLTPFSKMASPSSNPANPKSSKNSAERSVSTNRSTLRTRLQSQASSESLKINTGRAKKPLRKELDKKQLVERAAEILFQAAKHTRSKLRNPASEAIKMKQEEQEKTKELGMIFDRNRKEILKYIKHNPKN